MELRFIESIKNLIPYSFSSLNTFICKKIYDVSIELFDEYLKKNKIPNLIHAHKLRFSSFAAYAIHKKYKIPYVITEHNSDVIRNLFPKQLKNIATEIINNSQNFNTVSNINSKALKKYFNLPKVDILHNVLPEIFIKDSNQKKKKSKKNYNFLSVTRFDENKNVKLLIDVFIENFKNLNATLSIVGTGKLINKYRKIIIKNKMSKKIKFFGFLDRKSISTLYQRCNCFILPSHKETFGLSLMESLLFKNYCITSRHSGYYELKKNNINLPNFDSHDKNRLKKLMKDAFKKI